MPSSGVVHCSNSRHTKQIESNAQAAGSSRKASIRGQIVSGKLYLYDPTRSEAVREGQTGHMIIRLMDGRQRLLQANNGDAARPQPKLVSDDGATRSKVVYFFYPDPLGSSPPTPRPASRPAPKMKACATGSPGPSATGWLRTVGTATTSTRPTASIRRPPVTRPRATPSGK